MAGQFGGGLAARTLHKRLERRPQPAAQRLHQRISGEISRIPGVIKLRAFDLDGRVVYSSDPSQIGGDGAPGAGASAAGSVVATGTTALAGTAGANGAPGVNESGV